MRLGLGEGTRIGIGQVADIVIKAAYASVVEDDEDGFLFIGFAEGEEEDEPYVLFRQLLTGGPIWFEIGDEAFGAENAVAKVALTDKGLDIHIRPGASAKIGWANLISVRIGPTCEDAEGAVAALREMMGSSFHG